MCAAGHLFLFALMEGGPPTHPGHSQVHCMSFHVDSYLSGVLVNVLW